jgi:hypothetical protein
MSGICYKILFRCYPKEWFLLSVQYFFRCLYSIVFIAKLFIGVVVSGRCYSSVLVSSLVQIVTDVWYRYTGIVSVHIHNLLMVEKSLVLF